MSISIIKLPSVNINGYPSKWMPAHQPITIEVQRKDVTVLAKYKNGSEMHFKINGIPSGVVAGQTAYYINGTKSYTLTIKTVDYTLSYLVFEFVDGLNLAGNGFFILEDAIKGHYIETKVSYIDTSNTYREIGTLKNKTDNFGKSKISMNELLSTKCINRNEFNYDRINKKQFGEGSKFNFQLRQVSSLHVNESFTPLVDSNVMFYANAVNQIQDVYGYNMGSFVPTPQDSRTDKAKFQSVFNRPTYFVGYPFSLNFLYSDNMTNLQLTRKETTKGINGATIASNSDALFVSERNYANRLMLKQDYPSTVKTVEVWIESGSATTTNPIYSWNDLGMRYIEDGAFKPFVEKETFTRDTQTFTLVDKDAELRQKRLNELKLQTLQLA